jgi:hypothetical protein
MIAEIEMYRSAKVLIDHYGGGALLEAMTRQERFRIIGSDAGVALWRLIADAVEVLQMPACLSPQKVH